jgi:hypothetical protein
MFGQITGALKPLLFVIPCLMMQSMMPAPPDFLKRRGNALENTGEDYQDCRFYP